MGCSCFTATWERLNDEFTVTWERFCDTSVDLVPFSASDAYYLTNEGYTILVQI